MNKEYSQLSVTNTAILFIASALFAVLFRKMGLIIGHYTAYIVGAKLILDYRDPWTCWYEKYSLAESTERKAVQAVFRRKHRPLVNQFLLCVIRLSVRRGLQRVP